MKTNYIKQIVYDMRHHPMVTWVNILGTAMAIFLLMVVVQIDSIKVESFRPESNRDRMLHVLALGAHEKNGSTDNSNIMPVSYKAIQRLYGNLPGSEAMTTYKYELRQIGASLPAQKPITVKSREVDDQFFSVYDLKFISGKPFDHSKVGAENGAAVISESVARRLFGSIDVAGKTILLDYTSHTIAGVVEDVSSFASIAYADVWVALHNPLDETWCHILGPYQATILAESRDKFPEIRQEVKRRTFDLLNELKESTSVVEIMDYNQPMEHAVLFTGGDPWNNDYEGARRERWILYAILLIVPAINIASMTNSRMRQRLGEMAVMRSYGCTRWKLMGSLIMENLIVTLCAGIIGLAALLFAWLAPEFLFVTSNSVSYSNPTVNLSILFHWSTFFMAMAFCFVLNLMSSGIPAWGASRLNIINSLRGTK